MKSIQTNIVNSATFLAKHLNVKVTQIALRKAIEQNPHYPSLFSISDVYTRFNIPNQAFNLAAEQFQELEAPFIAYWKNDFVTVTKQSKETITYSDFDGKSVTSSTQTFLKDYKNIVLVAEPNAESGDPDFKIARAKERSEEVKRTLLLLGSTLTVLLVLTQFYFFNASYSIFGWLSILAIATKLVGLSTTVLLLVYEIDKSNALVKNICAAGKQTSCEAVLGSKASHIMGLSWSELGFFYYASMTLFLFFPGVDLVSKFAFVSITSALVSPYILFSIYYQWKVIKRWCPLCLAIQVTLLIELIWAFAVYQNTQKFFPIVDATLVIALMISVALPIISWSWIKPILFKLNGTVDYEAAYKRLLYNPEMFSALLQQQPEAPSGWQDIGIVVGNPLAQNSILKVCNPFCGPCAKAHPVLEDIVKRNSNYNLKVIFTSTNNPHDKGGQVARHLIAIDSFHDPKKIEQALDDWYLTEIKDYQNLATKYPMNGELEKSKDKLEAMGAWCREANIKFTPTIFINGKQLPETYGIDELKNIIG